MHFPTLSFQQGLQYCCNTGFEVAFFPLGHLQKAPKTTATFVVLPKSDSINIIRGGRANTEIYNTSPENLLLQPALLSGHFLECILKPGKYMENGLYSHLFILSLKNISQTVKATGFEVNCFIA